MKNKLSDLNDHLFAQMERLGNEDLKGDDLKKELARTKELSKIASEVIKNARLVLDANIFATEYRITDGIPVLGIEKKVK